MNSENTTISELAKEITVQQLFKILAVFCALVTGSFMLGYKFGAYRSDALTSNESDFKEKILLYTKKDKFLSMYLRYRLDIRSKTRTKALDRYIMKLSIEADKGAPYVQIGRGDYNTTVKFSDGSSWIVPIGFKSNQFAEGESLATKEKSEFRVRVIGIYEDYLECSVPKELESLSLLGPEVFSENGEYLGLLLNPDQTNGRLYFESRSEPQIWTRSTIVIVRTDPTRRAQPDE